VRLGRALAISIPIGLAIGIGVPLYPLLTAPDSPDPPPMGNRAMLDPLPENVVTGSRVTVTDSLRSHDESVWIDGRDVSLVVDETDVECHGGRAYVVWHIGNLEPQTSDVGIHLTARLDEAEIGSILRGSTVDTWGDSPNSIHAIVDCSAGLHKVDLLIRSIHGRWGFPYVVNEHEPPSPDLRVNRGFVVTEVWS